MDIFKKNDINLSNDFKSKIDESWHDILFAPKLTHIMTTIEKTIGPDFDKLAPDYNDIYNAFIYFPLSELKVIIIGQDPYPTPGHAVGLAFSINHGVKLAQSLLNIKDALINDGFTVSSGNMISWAMQGVLLLNCALTTCVKSTKSHFNVWEYYTDEILKDIMIARPDTILILWGNDAIYKEKLLNENCRKNILKWSHPSPLSDNRRLDHEKFKNCHHFSMANNILKSNNKQSIDWNLLKFIKPTEYPNRIFEINISLKTVIAFSDGSAINNGKDNCYGGYGVYMPAAPFYTPAGEICSNLGINESQLASEKLLINCTNNRAEFMAIMKSLELFIRQLFIDNSYKQLVIISDSEYCINSLCEWAVMWRIKKIEKLNMDLINQILDIIKKLKEMNYQINFIHMRGHSKDTKVCKHYKNANEIADKLAVGT